MLNPAGGSVVKPVDLITLTASGYSICLSDVMREIEALTRAIEEQLSEQFTDLPQAGADLLISMELIPAESTKPTTDV